MKSSPPIILFCVLMFFCFAVNAAEEKENDQSQSNSSQSVQLQEEKVIEPSAASLKTEPQSTDNAPKEPNSQDASSPTKAPLQGHLEHYSLGIRSLPEGREPDYVIGHFAVGLGPFINIYMNGPISNTVTLTAKILKKWNGRKIRPNVIKLTKLKDGSGGYFFNTLMISDGPTGWLMPMPKRPGIDKVVAWAVYYDQ